MFCVSVKYPNKIYRYFKEIFINLMKKIAKIMYGNSIFMVCLYCIIDIFGIKWGENMRLKGFDGQRNVCGPKIKEKRMKQKMTQTQLSELLKAYRIDLNQKVLSQIELQKRHVTEYEFVAIARALQVNPLDLVDLD